MDNEEDYLMMSGIQHFDFCQRQWALIHIEQEWRENVRTAEGRIDHKKCHDDSDNEKRKDVIIMRGLRVVSHELKMVGICDVVEFHSDKNGIELIRYDGKWNLFPIEYKHGHSQIIDADRLQLCAQGIALEEMFSCKIEYGYLFYKETRQRERVDFSANLREKVFSMAKEMNGYFSRGYTPKVRIKPKCKECSLNEICIPELSKKREVASYIAEYVEG